MFQGKSSKSSICCLFYYHMIKNLRRICQLNTMAVLSSLSEAIMFVTFWGRIVSLISIFFNVYITFFIRAYALDMKFSSKFLILFRYLLQYNDFKKLYGSKFVPESFEINGASSNQVTPSKE